MSVQYLERDGKNKLAYHYTPPKNKDLPTVFFLGGFKSDMNGSKATFLEKQCKSRGQGYVRFDYSGHGGSDGDFVDGTIGGWADDATAMFDHIAAERAILIGSSMGGWISLLLANKRSESVEALIGIAAAPDFTKDMWFNRLTDAQRQEIETKGRADLPNDYSDEPYILTKELFDDGENHFLLDKPQNLDIPMTLLQGMADPDVPWETTVRIQNAFEKADVDIVFIEDGDHSLSRPEDLEVLDHELMSLCNRNDQDNTF